MYGAVGGDMVNQAIRSIGSKLPGRSGSGVGTDVVGRAPMPVSKTPAPTNRGPRGNTNIDAPANPPSAPAPGTRNTGGVNDTERAMLDFMIPKNARNRAKEVERVIWNKDRFPKQSDRIAKRRPANAEEVNMIKAQEEGIMNTSPGKSYMEELGDLRELERINKRRNFLQTKTRYDQSLIKANEAPSKDFSKNLEELQRLEELLK
jgi:hypothetical protein